MAAVLRTNAIVGVCGLALLLFSSLLLSPRRATLDLAGLPPPLALKDGDSPVGARHVVQQPEVRAALCSLSRQESKSGCLAPVARRLPKRKRDATHALNAIDCCRFAKRHMPLSNLRI